MAVMDPESIPGTTGMRWECPLDHVQYMLIQTHSHLGQFSKASPPTGMFLGGGKTDIID